MANDKEVKVTIKAVDEASKTIDKIGKAISDLTKGTGGLGDVGGKLGKLGDIFGGLKGKASLAVTAIATVAKGFAKLYNASKQNFITGLQKIGSVCSKIVGALAGVAKGFLGIIAGVTGSDLSLSGLSQVAVNFEQSMKNLIAVTREENDTIEDTIRKTKEFNDEAIRLGAETKYTPYEIAEGMNELAQQGMNATDIVENMADVTNLAIAGNLELAESAELVAGALTIWKKQGITAKDVTDQFSKTALVSGATVEDYAQTIKYAGSTASALNIPMEQVSAVTAIMGNNFVKGSQAGTTLRRLLTNLSNPTAKVSAELKKYNLEGARQKILNGDLVGGLKDMTVAYNGMSKEQKTTFASNVAGVYAMSGFLAILNSGVDTLDTFSKAMQEATGSTDVLVQEMKNTLSYQFASFVSKIQVGAIQIYEAIKENLTNAMKFINDKFLGEVLKGNFEGAFKNLANASKNWGTMLTQGIQTAISKLGEFANGNVLKSVLQIGTNIIKGICQGIINAYNSGTLTSTISSFIGKITSWISENAYMIEQAGRAILSSLADGIRQNEDGIRSAMEAICGIIEGWVSGSGEIEALMGVFSDTLISSFLRQMGSKFGSKFTEFWNALNRGGVTSKAEDAGLVNGEAQGRGTQKGLEKSGEGIVQTSTQIGTESANAMNQALESMDTQQLLTLGQAFNSLSGEVEKAVGSMQKSLGGMRNTTRDAFVGIANICRNQMLNCSNIVRNQAVNWSNIIRNQVTNARNALTSQMISMASVTRTQMVNCSNIIRNQAVNWSNIIRNQAQNARNSLTSSFMSMHRVVATQMAKCLATVRSYMSQIASATSRTMTMNFKVSRTITTTNVTRNVPGTGTMGTIGRIASNTMGISSPSTMGNLASNAIGGYLGTTVAGGSYEFNIPLYLNGREVAKATATYNQEQLNKLDKRNKRRRGE